VGLTLLGRKILCQANITLYNPGPLPLTDFTLNVTVNMSNKLIQKCSETSYINYTGASVPLSNMIFAYYGPKGLTPMYTWIEAYNSTVADVWVRVPPALVILNRSYQVIYLIFVNTSLLGAGYLGVNTYYTNYPLYDNIGNVMARGVLVQVYKDYSRPPSIFVNSISFQSLLRTLYRTQRSCSYVYPLGLYGWLYLLPMNYVSETFTTSYLACSGGSIQSLPSPASGYFVSQLQAPISSDFMNGGLVLWGSTWVYGADVLFNLSSVPTGQTEWPGNVSSIYGNFLMKSIGWIAIQETIKSSANYLFLSSDDYAAITLAPTVNTWITTDYVNWILGISSTKLHVSYANLSTWASAIYKNSSGGYSIVDYTGPDSSGLAALTSYISLSSLNFTDPLGDYRAVITYAQVNPDGGSGFYPYDNDTYLAVFIYHSSGKGSPKPSTVAFPTPAIYWYSPIYPQGGIMPLLYCSVPNLLVLKGQPLVPTPPAPTPSAPGYGWIVA
ncbi:MAG: hypothetical protein ACP5HK_03455, partial [Acidilobus sp.]